MSLCSTVAITTAGLNTATVVTVEMSCSCIPLVLLTASVSLILFISPPSLPSLLVPLHSAALRTVDGGCRGEALRPAGERRGVSKRAGVGALRLVIHGGGCRRASGAHLWVDLHAGGSCIT